MLLRFKMLILCSACPWSLVIKIIVWKVDTKSRYFRLIWVENWGQNVCIFDSKRFAPSHAIVMWTFNLFKNLVMDYYLIVLFKILMAL